MAEVERTDSRCESPTNQARELIFGSGNLEYQVEQFIEAGGQSVKILLSGKTGVGKSHLTNALVGEELAKEGEDIDPETDEVSGYEFTKNNVNITVYDTPGLADATGQDEEYLERIKAKEIKFDLFLFCTEMNTIRFRNDDLETLKKLTETFGPQLWDHAVVALTFANEVRPSPSQQANNVPEEEVFSNRILGFKKKIKEVLIEFEVPEEAVVNVPFVPVGGSNEPQLPDRDNWMTAFWVAVFKRINRKAKAPFLLANVDRIAFSSPLPADDGNPENSEDDQSSRVVSDKEEEDIKESRQKLEDASFAEKYEEFGGEETRPEDPAAKGSVWYIKMDEASSRDIVTEMLVNDTGNVVNSLVSPAFEFVYQTFFGSIVRNLKKQNT